MDIEHKLAHLVPHWIEHNEAHAESYREWERLASEAGMAQVAKGIGQAVAAVEEANRALTEALKHIS